MSQPELLIYLAKILEEASIPYMITGSTVSSLQGAPRLTHDIDVVIGISPSKIQAILAAFPSPRFYVEEEAIKDAMMRGGMFNVIDNEDGDKVDFWILKPDSFNQSMFHRRVKQTFRGNEIYMPQPEDTILSKLSWAKACGGSEKQMGDCIAVYEVNMTNLNMEYLTSWAEELGVKELLREVQRRAQTEL